MTHSEEKSLEGVYAPEVLRLVRSANDFCGYLDHLNDEKGVNFIRKTLGLAAELYAAALPVTEFEPMLETGNEKFVTEQEWSAVYQSVLRLLGNHNTYLRIAEDDEFDRSDLVSHTISEDLADVYQDVKDFTLQYRQGIEEIMNDAVYEVKESFDQYWSKKLLHVMIELNSLFVHKVDPGEEEETPPDTRPKYDNSFFTRKQDSNEEEV